MECKGACGSDRKGFGRIPVTPRRRFAQNLRDMPLLPCILLLLTIAACVAPAGSEAPAPTAFSCGEAIARGTVGDAVACGGLDDGTGTGTRIYCTDHCAPLGLECVPDLVDGAPSPAGTCGVHPCAQASCGDERLGKVCIDACNVWETIGAGPDPAAPEPTLVWPSPRGHAAMAALVRPDGSRTVVLFGGAAPDGRGGLTALADGFELTEQGDGFVWTAIPAGPPGRHGASMVRWAREGGDALLLFGGRSDAAALDDLWRFDEAGWQELPVDGPRPARSYGGLVYDPGPPARLVQFGGDDVRGTSQETTFELRLDEPPLQWRALATSTTGPGPRKGLVLVRDEGSGELLLIGGDLPRDGLAGDLWRLGAAGWEELRSEAMPARKFAAATWDPAHGTVVVYGGFGDTGEYTSACDLTFPFEHGWHNDDTWAFEKQGTQYLVSRPLVTGVEFPDSLGGLLEVADVRCPTGRFGAVLAPAPRGASTPDKGAGPVLFGGRFKANGLDEARSDLSHFVPLPRYLSAR